MPAASVPTSLIMRPQPTLLMGRPTDWEVTGGMPFYSAMSSGVLSRTLTPTVAPVTTAPWSQMPPPADHVDVDGVGTGFPEFLAPRPLET